jgi:hypothetical protein
LKRANLRRKWSTISKAGWSWGCISAFDCEGRTIWIADAYRDDGSRSKRNFIFYETLRIFFLCKGTNTKRELMKNPTVALYDKACTFLPIVLLSFLMVCPIGAQAGCDTGEEGDIPFKVFNRAGVAACLKCEGPWFRSTVAFRFDNRVPSDGCIFYRAKNTAFSPYGGWKCFLYDNCSGRPRSNVQFTLERSSVELIVDRLGLSVNQPRNGAVKAMSSLGDNANASQAEGTSSPDIDVFQFAGTAGDAVTVRLEADPAAGNNNGVATLSVQGGSPRREKTGTLPLDIRVVISATSTYDITIEQIAGEQSYSGGYILSVDSSRGLIDTLTPVEN